MGHIVPTLQERERERDREREREIQREREREKERERALSFIYSYILDKKLHLFSYIVRMETKVGLEGKVKFKEPKEKLYFFRASV